MPSMDRRWRWFYVIGLLIGVYFGVALPLYSVFGQALIDYLYGVPIQHAFDSISWGDISGVVFGPFLVWAIYSGIRGMQRRERQRTLALVGEADAMLPAHAVAPVGDAALPDLVREPLRLLWHTRKGSTGVLATSEGLIWRRPRKRDMLVRWNEARLFEVWQFMPKQSGVAGYALFDGARHLIEWQDYNESQAPAAEDGATYVEMQKRQRTLLALIVARTGLQPRTLALELADLLPTPVVPAQRRTGLRRLSLLGTLILAVLAGGPLAVAFAVLALPLTTSPLINAYVAVTVGGLGLFILGFVIRVSVDTVRGKPAAPPPLVVLPPAPPELRELARPLRLRGVGMPGQRIGCLVVASLLAGDCYALVRNFIDFLGPGGDNWFADNALHSLVSTALLIILLLGMIICGMGIFERRRSVVVDAEGLHYRRGQQRKTLIWENMARLVAYTNEGKLISFRVESDDANATYIIWAANARWSPQQTVNIVDSDAAELAALVAQRTGLALTVESEA